MKAYLLVGAVAGAEALLTFTHFKAYQAGRSVEQAAFMARIEEENTDAANRAENWRAELRRCNASGGLFDFETAACEH
jgi:hypothetical protein